MSLYLIDFTKVVLPKHPIYGREFTCDKKCLGADSSAIYVRLLVDDVPVAIRSSRDGLWGWASHASALVRGADVIEAALKCRTVIDKFIREELSNIVVRAVLRETAWGTWTLEGTDAAGYKFFGKFSGRPSEAEVIDTFFELDFTQAIFEWREQLKVEAPNRVVNIWPHYDFESAKFTWTAYVPTPKVTPCDYYTDLAATPASKVEFSKTWTGKAWALRINGVLVRDVDRILSLGELAANFPGYDFTQARVFVTYK
jgi:hypothetical protein